MMNIYWFEFFLTVMQGDIGDTGGMVGEELSKQLSLLLLLVYRRAAYLLNYLVFAESSV